MLLNAPHPAIFQRDVLTNPEQNRASQYELDNRRAPAPHPAWMNYYRADPIEIPASVDDKAALDVAALAARLYRDVTVPPRATTLEVHRPTLVIWGMRDTALRPGLLNGLDAYLRHVEIVKIDEADHYPMRSHPDFVNARIRAFLAR